MVKGISKRVIVVKTPVPGMFEQAIFIMGDNSFSNSVDAENILHEACAVADDYVRTHCGGKKRVSRKTVITVMSTAAITFALSALIHIFFI